MLSRGNIYTTSEIEKWLSRDIDFELEVTIDTGWVSEGIKKFSQLQEFDNCTGPTEKERIESSRKLTFWLGEYLWNEDKDLTHEEVVTLMMGTFYNLEGDAEELFEKLPQEIRKRNVFVGSYLVGVLLACGFNDFEYLKDSFNICLFLDYKLCFEIWDSAEKDYLLNVHDPKMKRKIDKEYTLENSVKFKRQLMSVLTSGNYYLGTLKVLDFYFEKLNGEGAPFGISFNNLSDLELAVIFLLSGTDKNVSDDYKGSASSYYKKIANQEHLVVSKRISGYLEQGFERGKEEGFLKVSGL